MFARLPKQIGFLSFATVSYGLQVRERESMVSCDSLAIRVLERVTMWIMYDRSMDSKSGVSNFSSALGFRDSEDPYPLNKIVCEIEDLKNDARRSRDDMVC